MRAFLAKRSEASVTLRRATSIMFLRRIWHGLCLFCDLPKPDCTCLRGTPVNDNEPKRAYHVRVSA